MRTRKPLNPVEGKLLGESLTFGIKMVPWRACNKSFRAIFDLFWALEGLRRKVGQ